MPRENKIVRVSSRSRAALAEPTFIVEKDGVLYITLAVVAYDPRDADTEEQKEGVERMRRLFEGVRADSPLPCAQVEFSPGLSRLVQTNPDEDEGDEF